MEEPVRSVVLEAKLGPSAIGRGLVTLFFGFLALANPWMGAGHFAALFAAYVFVDGALALYGAYRARGIARGRLPLAIEAGVSVLLGVLAIALPAASALRILGGLRGVLVGGSDVAWSRQDERADLLEMAGIISVMFGIVILAWPGHGPEALPWLLGVPAVASGSLLLAGALKQFTVPVLAER